MDFSLFGDFPIEKTTFKDVFAYRVQPGELHVGGAGGDAGAASRPCNAGISGTHKALLPLYKFLQIESKWQMVIAFMRFMQCGIYCIGLEISTRAESYHNNLIALPYIFRNKDIA
jgi:hypothetical protein